MKPFLLITTRPERELAAAELASFHRHGRLAPGQIVQVLPHYDPLPDWDLSDYSGVMLGGSPYDFSEPHKDATQRAIEARLSSLIDLVLATGVPFFGACYGIGTLGVHQGGVIGREYGEAAQAVEITLTEAGRADPLLAELPERFPAFVGHKEALTVAPPTATILASSAGCPVQMFRIGEHAYATQFHPELDLAAFAQRIRRYDGHGYFPPGGAEDLIAEVSRVDVSPVHRILAAFTRRYART
ncbi:glutamine amidotransferase [Pseudactinotalea sp. HY158]|uniref:glutamine amidotransferase n=1 Tax=Pseudactinotalea sp. HY158 TaxID=2654547 RepID=UPI00129C44DE|nr:glutamine amidotransferase [Pseudactinotalea sp. HY158]QGH68332.1 glutamine amidotransferase [Pseudactinotalea sp. HY158]